MKSKLIEKLQDDCLHFIHRQVIKKLGTNEIVKVICLADSDYAVSNDLPDSMHKFGTKCPSYTERYLASIYEK